MPLPAHSPTSPPTAAHQTLRSVHFMFIEGSSGPVSQDGTGLLLLEGVGGSRDAYQEGVALGLLQAELQQVGSRVRHLHAVDAGLHPQLLHGPAGLPDVTASGHLARHQEEGQGRLPRGGDNCGCWGKTRGLCSMWRLWRFARHEKGSISYLMRMLNGRNCLDSS